MYFKIGFPTEAEGTFVIELTDPAKIQQARDAIRDPENQPHSVLGIIVKQSAAYNPPWTYHLDPPTIELFERAIEVCDAAPQYVEEHLAEACGAFLPDCRWCPWSSKVLEEVRPRSHGSAGSGGAPAAVRGRRSDAFDRRPKRLGDGETNWAWPNRACRRGRDPPRE